MTIFLISFFVILFFPIPLKFIICYSEENYYVKLFNINIIKKKTSDKKNEQVKNSTNNTSNKDTPPKKHSKKIQSDFLKPKTIIKGINNSRFKPFLWLKGNFDYSINDAALTAISYGLLSAIFPLLIRGFNIFFKIKKFSLPIKPLFKDKLIVKIEIKCIICFSIVQIIYIIFSIVKEMIKEMEANPLLGNL